MSYRYIKRSLSNILFYLDLVIVGIFLFCLFFFFYDYSVIPPEQGMAYIIATRPLDALGPYFNDLFANIQGT